MLCSHPDKVVSWGVHDVGFSDHSLWKVKYLNDANTCANFVSFRKSRGVDIDAFKADMRSKNWSRVETSSSLDEAVFQWEELVMNVVD